MFILGVGSATAQHKLSANRLKELGASIDTDAPTSRSTILAENIFESPKDRLLTAAENTTLLGKAAVEKASENAGIKPEEIGLIIGDCATPTQTTPSEGQRITGKLGLKIPSYDISGGAVANILHVDTARRWKSGKLPNIAAFVSSNCPTHALDFHDPITSFFADGASAVIVSNEKLTKKAFRVVDSEISFDYSNVSSGVIKKLAGGIFDREFVATAVTSRLDKVLLQLKQKKGELLKASYLCLGVTGFKATKETAVKAGFRKEAIFSAGADEGDMLGASLFYCLDTFKSQIPTGATVFLVGAGVGAGFGFLQLHSEES